jgi:hypothetical protein
MSLHHPIRGGTRGGKDQFKWKDVETDKDRECYLGHSLMAPVGRWQQGKDIIWYARDNGQTSSSAEAAGGGGSVSSTSIKSGEFQQAKEMEEKALMAALGYKVKDKPSTKLDNSQFTEAHAQQRNLKEKSMSASNKSDKQKANALPPTIDFNKKEQVDGMLTKLLDKYPITKIFDALQYTTSSDESSDSTSDDYSNENERKSKHKKSKKHKKKSKKKKKEENNSTS